MFYVCLCAKLGLSNSNQKNKLRAFENGVLTVGYVWDGVSVGYVWDGVSVGFVWDGMSVGYVWDGV